MASQQNVNITDSNVGIANNGGVVKITGNVVAGSYSEESFKKLELPRVSRIFKGREQDIVKLDALFFQDGNRKVVIFGLPGFGKTELAKKFAKHCTDSNKIDKAFWINAETSENLKELHTTLENVYNNFNNKRCLFIFDNGVSRKSIAKYEPPEIENFFLLITSQIAYWGDDMKQMSLKPLNMEASIDVFREILGNRYQKVDEKLYKKMIENVSNAPLGLIVIVGHLRSNMDACKQNKFNIYQFLNEISTTMLANEIHHSLPNSYERSIYAAMSVCLDKMLKQDFAISKQIREQNAKLLGICAFLNPEYIHISEIKEIMERSEAITMDECVYLSENFSFIEYYDGVIKIHRLCQTILKLYFNDIRKECYSACVRWLLRKEYRFNWHEDTILVEADNNKEIIFEIYKQIASENNFVVILLILLVGHGCRKCCKLIFHNIISQKRMQYIDNLKLLHLAIKRNQADVLKLLLNYGDLNVQDIEGRTPMHWASWQGNVDIVRMLLDKEGDLQAQDSKGRTPLHEASQGGNIEIVRMLLEKGADVDAQDSEGHTSLHLASYQSNVDIVEMLLNKKANVHIQDTVGRTPLHAACFKGNSDILQMMLEKGGDVDARDSEGHKLIHLASHKGNVDIVRILLKAERDVDAPDSKGRTSLHLASYQGSVDIVRLLLEKGGNIDAQDNEGHRLLHLASYKGNVDIVRILLQKQINVDARDNKGRTSLHLASYQGNVDIVRKLLEKKGDINAQDNEGHTPLHWAVLRGDVSTVLVLLEKGGNLHARDIRGNTPLDWATVFRQTDIINILQ